MKLLKKLFTKPHLMNGSHVTPPSFFYFYFPAEQEKKIKQISKVLEQQGYLCTIQMFEKDINPKNEWRLQASRILTSQAISKVYLIDNELQELGYKFGGDYDGHEVPLI